MAEGWAFSYKIPADDYGGLVDFADFDRSYLDQDGPVSPY